MANGAAIGIAIGAGIGLIFGILTDNIGIAVGIGAALWTSLRLNLHVQNQWKKRQIGDINVEAKLSILRSFLVKHILTK